MVDIYYRFIILLCTFLIRVNTKIDFSFKLLFIFIFNIDNNYYSGENNVWLQCKYYKFIDLPTQFEISFLVFQMHYITRSIYETIKIAKCLTRGFGDLIVYTVPICFILEIRNNIQHKSIIIPMCKNQKTVFGFSTSIVLAIQQDWRHVEQVQKSDISPDIVVNGNQYSAMILSQ